jgi:hypothetical protein
MSGTRTLAEIRATCTKAARGAGCPWGLAEEAGLAVRVLEAHGLPGVPVLARLFEGPRDCQPGCSAAPRCGLKAMAALSDDPRAVPQGQVAAPLLLAAPLLMAARKGAAATLRWEGADIGCSGVGVVADGALDAAIAEGLSVETEAPGTGVPRPPDWRSRPVDPAHWAALEALAAQTLVPETEASRRAGAGPDT